MTRPYFERIKRSHKKYPYKTLTESRGHKPPPIWRYSVAIQISIHSGYHNAVGQYWGFKDHEKGISRVVQDYLVDFVVELWTPFYAEGELWFIGFTGEGWQPAARDEVKSVDVSRQIKLRYEDEEGHAVATASVYRRLGRWGSMVDKAGFEAARRYIAHQLAT